MQQAPAADRNKQPILEALIGCLGAPDVFNGYVLEIASGTGQHVTHFAQTFQKAIFQPTDFDPANLTSIAAYISHHQLHNVLPPQHVDITSSVTSWPGEHHPESCDVIYNANMVHISPWQTAIGLFEAASYLLKKDGLLITYGPYAENGVLQPESNIQFDLSLKSRDPSWGVRDIRDLSALAEKNGIALVKKVDMPSNNKMLIWKKS